MNSHIDDVGATASIQSRVTDDCRPIDELLQQALGYATGMDCAGPNEEVARMAATSFLKRVTVIALLSLGIAQAQASFLEIDQTGTVSEGAFSSFNIGDTHYDQRYLWLTKFDSANPITASVGDIINATVTLDQSFTIPAPMAYRPWVELDIGGGAFPMIDTATSNVEAAFVNRGVPGLTGGRDCRTNGRLAGCELLYGADMSNLTFDKMTISCMMFYMYWTGKKP